jgi:hypothetical protein
MRQQRLRPPRRLVRGVAVILEGAGLLITSGAGCWSSRSPTLPALSVTTA